MTRERINHFSALFLLIAALAAGAVSWVLEDTAFWVALGLALVLIIAGIFAAGRASAKPRGEEERKG